MSDSTYAKKRFHFTHATISRAYPARPANIDLIDDDWAADALSDDDVELNVLTSSTALHEALLEFHREEEALEGDGVNVGTNFATTPKPSIREDEQFNDLGLDALSAELALTTIRVTNANENRREEDGRNEQQQQQSSQQSTTEEGEDVDETGNEHDS